MVDPADIQKTYASMSDRELLRFIESDGGHLTGTALQILKSEMLQRNLKSEMIQSIEDGTYFEAQLRLQTINKIVPEHFGATALNMAINEKRDGHTDENILYHLLDEGLEEERARIIIGQIKPTVKNLLKKAHNGMLSSVFIAFAGLGLKLISPEKGVVTFLDITATCTLVFGILRFLKSFFEQNKFKAVIRNIKREHKERNKTSND